MVVVVEEEEEEVGGWGGRLFNPLIVKKGHADPKTQLLMINMGGVLVEFIAWRRDMADEDWCRFY